MTVLQKINIGDNVSSKKEKSKSFKVFIKTLILTVAVVALLLIGYFTAGILSGEL